MSNNVISRIEETLKTVADANLERFKTIGHAVEGHNGPYGHADTPVRNTSHWSIVFGHLWKKYGDKRYYEAMIQFAEYVCDIQSTSKSGAVECMKTDLFDHLNGLIGQAWAIESLIYVAQVSSLEKYYSVAKSIFDAPAYDHEVHLWRRTELDGTDIGIDPTLNHQLYFTYAGVLINAYRHDEKILKTTSDFMSNLPSHFSIHKDGLIKHYVNIPGAGFNSNALRTAIKTIGRPLRTINPDAFDINRNEVGYHLFDMYILAMLFPYFKDAAIYISGVFEQAKAYSLDIHKLNKELNVYNFMKLQNTPLKKLAKINKFSYGYNSPAFEYPTIAFTFGGNRQLAFEDIAELWEIQTKWYLGKDGLYSRNNYDKETLTARIYEIIFFLETFGEANE